MFQKPSPVIAINNEPKDLRPGLDEVETVVGPSVNVEGDFSSEGNIVVKGTVTGSVKTSKKLSVEVGAKIFANVKAGDAVISGEVKGDVKVTEELHLTSTARVAGDIDCKVLAVEAGALIYGRVAMKGMEPEKKVSGLGRFKMKTEEESGVVN